MTGTGDAERAAEAAVAEQPVERAEATGHAAAVRAAAGSGAAATVAPGAPSPAGPPPLPPLFGDTWPAPATPPSAAMVIATAVAGVASAGAIPSGRPGLGWLVVALVAVAAALAADWRGRRITPAGAWWTVVTIALAAVGTVRAADWLAAVCVLAAFGTATLAVVGRSGRGVWAAAATVALAACRALPWFSRAATDRADLRRLVRIGVALMVAALMLLVFGSLFAEADPVFGKLVEGLSPTLDEDVVRWAVLFALGAAAMGGICFLARSAPRPPAPAARARLPGLEWTIPVGLLVALFAAFLAVTVTTMFGGDAYVQATAGVTYAEYARGGFWQLLTVTVLALLVIITAARFAPVDTPVQRRCKRGLLVALTLLTLLVVASATHRMLLYQQAYGHTVLRLLVLTFELWLGLAFVLVTASVLRLRDRVPMRAMVGTGVAALLALAVLDPERMIAEQNVERFTATGAIDAYYLSTLSADALGPLDGLPELHRTCIERSILLRTSGDDWRSANLTRAAASDRPVPGCADPGILARESSG